MMGRLIAQAGLLEGKYVSWLPSYGAEMRGGTAHCMVIVSKDPIASVYIEQPDHCIIMNAPSLTKFLPRIKKGGLVIVNLEAGKDVKRKDITSFIHFFTEEASQLGTPLVANVVALAFYTKATNLLKKKSLEEAVELMFKDKSKDLIELNKKALERGWKLYQQKDGKG